MADIRTSFAQSVGPQRRFQEVFFRGVKIRSDVIYTDPETGVKYRVKSVTGAAPSVENIKGMIARGSVREDTGVKASEVSPQLEEEVSRGIMRDRQLTARVKQAKKLGVSLSELPAALGKQEQQRAEYQRLQGIARQQFIERRTPTTQAEFATSLFERQGRDLKLTTGGGAEIVTPKAAIVRPEFAGARKFPIITITGERLTPLEKKEIREQVRLEQAGLKPPKLKKDSVRQLQFQVSDETVGGALSKKQIEAINVAAFEKEALALKARDERFLGSSGFQRIGKVAGAMTGGLIMLPGSPLGKLGIKETLEGTMGFPIAMGGVIPSTIQKTKLTLEAATIPSLRGNILPEFKRAGREALKVYTKPETYTTAGLFGLHTAAGMRLAGRVGPFKEGVKGKITTFTLDPVQTIVKKVAPVSKRGTIKKIGLTPGLEYTSKLRVKPESYLQLQFKKWNLDVNYKKMVVSEGESVLGLFREYRKSPGTLKGEIEISLAAPYTRKIYTGKPGRPRLETKLRLETPDARQMTVAHELIHYKTPLRILDATGLERLPYRLRPSEVLAFGMEKGMAKRGFKIEPSDVRYFYEPITVIKKGPLKFEYPRMQVLEKASKKGPKQSVSFGEFSYGGRKFELLSTTVGRKTKGTITKTSLGEPIKIEFQSVKGGKLRFDFLDTSGEIIKTTYMRPTKDIPIKIKQAAFNPKLKKSQFDVGGEYGGSPFYNLRTALRERVSYFFGEAKGFKLGDSKSLIKTMLTGRDVRKSISGYSKASLKQIDKAGFQINTRVIGGDVIKEVIPTTIKYARQPTYRPNLKLQFEGYKQRKAVSEVWGLEVVRTGKYKGDILSVKRGELRNQKITQGTGFTTDVFKVSQIKPLKSISRFMDQMGKGGTLTAGKFRQRLRQKPVKVETEMPSIGKQRFRQTSPVDPITLTNIMKGQGRTIRTPKTITRGRSDLGIGLRSYVRAETGTKSFTRAKTFSRARAKVNVETKSKERLKIPTINALLPKSETRVQPTSKSITRTQIRTRTTAITRTMTRTGTPAFSTTGGITPERPPPPVTFFGKPKTELRKRKKKKKRTGVVRPFKFTASIVPAEFGKRGVTPRPLTGVSPRLLLPKAGGF